MSTFIKHEFFNVEEHQEALNKLPKFLSNLKSRHWAIDAYIVYEVTLKGMTWRSKPYVKEGVQRNTHILIKGSRHGEPGIGRYMYSHEQAKWIQKYRTRLMYAGSKWFWDHWVLASDERFLAMTNEEFIDTEHSKEFNY